MGRQPRALQLVTPPLKICRISARVMVVRRLAGWTITAMPSKAMAISTSFFSSPSSSRDEAPGQRLPGWRRRHRRWSHPLHIDADPGVPVHIDLRNFSAKGCTEVEPAMHKGRLVVWEEELHPRPQEHQKRGDQGQSRPPAPVGPPDFATAPSVGPRGARPWQGLSPGFSQCL